MNQIRYLTTLTLVQIALTCAILFTSSAQAALLAPRASEIDRSVTAALRQLYSHNEAARALGAKAKGVLVFPDIKKGAFILGAQYGYGHFEGAAELWATTEPARPLTAFRLE